MGHFAQCCLKRKSLNWVGQPTLQDEHSTTLASLESLQSMFSHHVLAEIKINRLCANALVNTGTISEAELLEANPHYAHVRLEDGREITVSLQDLAPNPTLPTQRHDVTENVETDGYSHYDA